MIEPTRLGALLRALIRDDIQVARLRTPAMAPVRAAAALGPELAPPQAGETAPLQGSGAASPQSAEDARHVDIDPQARSGAPDNAARAGADRSIAGDAGRSGGPSTALELSDTGRLLLEALRPLPPDAGAAFVQQRGMEAFVMPGGAHTPGMEASGVAARALVSVPPHSEFATDRLALQIKDAVEFSGVFYESHLAQWADDVRPRALLAHEPQSRWPFAASADTATSAAHVTSPAAAASSPASDYAAQLLRQQLQVLDTGRFSWHGELWPGQRGSLTIEEDDAGADGQGGAATHPARWRMRVGLAFGALGTIEATLALDEDALSMALQCDASVTGQRLRSAEPALRAALASRDLDLVALSIDHGRTA